MTDSEIVAMLREHLMLEVQKEGLFAGKTMLWHLPFGRSHKQFGEIIKYSIWSHGNYYDDPILTLFEQLLGPCEGAKSKDERAFAVTSVSDGGEKHG